MKSSLVFSPSAVSMASLCRPAAGPWVLRYDLLLVVLGSVALALSAQVSVRLHPALSPVPITAQSVVVLILAALMGARRAVATVGLYLTEGACGLPVFANGGAGVLYLAGPTGGYLAGFLLAAFVVGSLAQRGWDRRVPTTAIAMLMGTVLIFLPGVSWLAVYVGPERAIEAGLLPFLTGAAIKIALATALLPAGWRAMSRFRR